MSLDGQRPTRTPEWVSIHEAALLMGVSPATLRRWSDAGDIRTFTTPGGHRRFSLTAIAGLLPSTGPMPASRDLVLDEVRQRTGRFVARGLRRMARDPAWSSVIDGRDLAALEADAALVVEGVLATIGSPRTKVTGAAGAAAREAAVRFGEFAGGRGIGRCQGVELCMRLRHLVVHELSIAARRHEMEVSTATRWLDAASRSCDVLLADAIRRDAVTTASHRT